MQNIDQQNVLVSKEVFKFLDWNISHKYDTIIVNHNEYIQGKIKLCDIPLKRKGNPQKPLTKEELSYSDKVWDKLVG